MDYKRKFKDDSDISVKDVILLENNVYALGDYNAIDGKSNLQKFLIK